MIDARFLVPAFMLVCGGSGFARAQEDAGRAPLSAVERVLPSGRRSAAPLSLAVSGGYGYTESVLGASDAHHRMTGVLAVEAAPVRWLGAGLRLDGRYDRHAFAGAPSDDGWTGEPRLFARADHGVHPDVSLGARLSFWLPGGDAPSISTKATTAEAIALASWSPGAGRTFLSTNVGYRLDRSARSVSDASKLARGDRVGLGVSQFDAVLVGAGVTHDGPSSRWRLFGEWTWDKLVGAGAPGAGSPMRVGVGARLALSRTWAAETLAELGVGPRPQLGAGAPLVPVPPRLAVVVGLLTRFGDPPLAAAPVAAPVEVAAPVRPAAPARIEGRIVFDGPIPSEAAVTVRAGGRQVGVAPDGEGRFVLQELPAGPAELEVAAPGYAPATSTVDLGAGEIARVELTLKRRLPVGQIRGIVRSFGGLGLAATIRVVGKDQTAAELAPAKTRAEDGVFQFNVQPGAYEVSIDAPGYETQRRNVRVEENGVTVLNVDLRRAR